MAGAVTSAAASLTVNPAPVAPSITSQPAGQTVTVGGDASFSVTANGTAPIFYQWRRNGVNLAGATSASLALSNCQTNQAGTYSVIVSNSVGSVASSGALLAVDVPTTPFSLTITGQGNVTPNLSGQNLVIGANYTITAVPHAGNGFAGWSGSLTGTNVSLTFTMQPGLALTAAFQPVISTNVTGSYCGLFYEGAGARYETAGLVEMTARNGRVIGALKIGASRFAFRQQLDATGAGSAAPCGRAASRRKRSQERASMNAPAMSVSTNLAGSCVRTRSRKPLA